MIGALGGTSLGWFLNGRSERRREKRDAFVELLSAMNDCQQACSVLSTAITMKATDPELGRLRSTVLDTVHRVEAAVILALFTVGPEQEEVLRNGGIACTQEMGHANRGVDTMGIVEARNRILQLGRRLR